MVSLWSHLFVVNFIKVSSNVFVPKLDFYWKIDFCYFFSLCELSESRRLENLDHTNSPLFRHTNFFASF